MRVAFISDIHANAPALKEVLMTIDNKGIDQIYCAGDIVGYNAFPNRTVALMVENNVTSIRGNHDEAVLTETPSNFNIQAKRAIDWTRRKLSSQSQEYLENLGSEIRREIGGRDIYITHGSPLNNLNQYVTENEITEWRIDRWFENNPDLIVLGHTHIQFKKKINDTIVLNPGSVGQPRDSNSDAAFAIFDTTEEAVHTHRVEYDIDKTAERTKAVLPRKLADRLYEGR